MPEMTYCPYCSTKLSLKSIEGRDYMACPAHNCTYVFWDNPLPVVAALIEHQGNVLLARNRQWPQKMFGLITGFLEKGESPQSAVLREVKEELGLDAELIGLIGVYPFIERNQIIMVYHVGAGGEIRLGEELSEVKSVPPDRLKPWPFGTGPAVRDWLERRKEKVS